MTDSDKTMTKYRTMLRPTPEADTPRGNVSQAAACKTEGGPRYQAYEAFENEVRTTSVEMRCHRSGLSYFMQYAHMSAIVFNFRQENEIFFTGDGYAVTIVGRRLRPVVLALRLHTCGTIEDFNPDLHVDAQPLDPKAPLVECITVEVLRPQKPGDAVPAAAKRTEKT